MPALGRVMIILRVTFNVTFNVNNILVVVSYVYQDSESMCKIMKCLFFASGLDIMTWCPAILTGDSV
jgi:hypothetical protein